MILIPVFVNERVHFSVRRRQQIQNSVDKPRARYEEIVTRLNSALVQTPGCRLQYCLTIEYGTNI
jgi:hypothetical protein